LHKILIKEITNTIRPKGFYDINDELKQIFLTGKFVGFNENLINEDDHDKKICKNSPYLPPNTKKFTMFFELDVFMKFSNNILTIEEKNLGDFKQRPYTNEFFKKFENDYEFVIFTELDENLAKKVANKIGIEEFVDHILPKEYLTLTENKVYKDLKNTGRSLDNSLILETDPGKFKNFKENGIWIEKWTEQEEKNYLEFFINLIDRIKGENLVFNLKRVRDYMIRRLTGR
jgi:hypothetical protein